MTHLVPGTPLTLPPHEPRGTSNIEHPTPNIEWQRESSLTSAFGVRCWTFDVFPRFSCSMREIFRGILSPHPMRGEGRVRGHVGNSTIGLSFSASASSGVANPAHEKRRTCGARFSLSWGERDGVRASVISHSFRNSQKNLGGVPRGYLLKIVAPLILSPGKCGDANVSFSW